MDKFFVYRPLLDLIGLSEGTDKGDGYNETLAYGAYTGGDVNLVSKTLAEIDKLQTKMLAHPRNKWKSSAIGRYQVVRTTLRSIKKTLDWPPTMVFNKDTQDTLCCFLLGRRGIDDYLAGELPEDNMLIHLAQEWASLPTPAGKGYYDGQNASVSPVKVRAVLAEVRARHKGLVSPTVDVPTPREPMAPAATDSPLVKFLKKLIEWLS